MNRLTLACRNMLVQTPQVVARVADGTIGGQGSAAWSDGWIFADKPEANIEKRSHRALIVLTSGGNWQSPNPHNTAQFPLLLLDIWASPTRNADGSPSMPDADLLIEDIFAEIRPYLHTVDLGVPGIDSDPALPYLGRPGYPRFWGTAEEIANRTGTLIVSSQHVGGPDFADVKDGNGARFARYTFGIQTA
jgi:hypothetical protein